VTTSVDAADEVEPVTPRERFAAAAYEAASWLARRLPAGPGRAIFGAVGIVAFHLAPRLRAIVAANQARVIGRAVDDPLVVGSTREAFRRYARYWYDSFAIGAWPADDVARAFVWEGDAYLFEYFAAGRGIIAVLPHLGNWDASARAMADRGLPMVAVAERLRPERLFQLFVRQREEYGVEVIGLGGNGSVGRALTNALTAGKLVGLMADRDLTGRGVEVQMFGATRRLPAGPAMLALSTGAPIVVVGTIETPTGWHGIVWPLEMPALVGDRRTDARAITQAIAEAFERLISISPADWHVFMPAWPDAD
jgi:KDO2-lipid IV(A) lauroyltransferase